MRVFIIQGPQGSGKTEIANKLASVNGVVLSEITPAKFSKVEQEFLRRPGSRIFVEVQDLLTSQSLELWLSRIGINSITFNII